MIDGGAAIIEWVSKSDMTDHYRCPRAYWLLAHGLMDRGELFGEAEVQKLQLGVAFEQSVLADMPEVPDDFEPLTDPGGDPTFLFEPACSTTRFLASTACQTASK